LLATAIPLPAAANLQLFGEKSNICGILLRIWTRRNAVVLDLIDFKSGKERIVIVKTHYISSTEDAEILAIGSGPGENAFEEMALHCDAL